jgi:hypothetical protein
MAEPSKSEEYRAHAQECEAKAGSARDPLTKEQYLDMALRWREMAEQTDRTASLKRSP